MSYIMSNDKLCRACLVSRESFDYNLFDNVSPEIYSFCTSIEIKVEEDLPRGLCNFCYQLMTKFSDFKRSCIQSQNTLISYNYIIPEVTLDHEFLNMENAIYGTGFEQIVKPESSDHGDDGFVTKHEINENHALIKNIEYTNYESTSDSAVDNPCDGYYFRKINDIKIHVPVKQECTSNLVHFNYDANVSDLKHKTNQNQARKKKIKLKRNAKNEIVKKTLTGKKCFSCNICDKIFYSSTSCKTHKLTHNSKKLSIQCLTCTKTFMTRSGLRRHSQSSHTKVNLKSLKCEICGKILKSKETLKIHVKTHGERKVFVCDTCGKSCTTPYGLKAHIETHRENRERQFTCEHCGKKFYTNSMVISHVSRKHSGRRFICDLCSYAFTDKSNLAKHLLLHEGKKLYKCNVCYKSYGAKSTLVEHVRIHSGERPHVCNYCPKGFLSKRRLTEHHRIHTGEKPYKCHLCDQAFAQCGTLNRHFKVHKRNVPALT